MEEQQKAKDVATQDSSQATPTEEQVSIIHPVTSASIEASLRGNQDPNEKLHLDANQMLIDIRGEPAVFGPSQTALLVPGVQWISFLEAEMLKNPKYNVHGQAPALQYLEVNFPDIGVLEHSQYNGTLEFDIDRIKIKDRKTDQYRITDRYRINGNFTMDGAAPIKILTGRLSPETQSLVSDNRQYVTSDPGIPIDENFLDNYFASIGLDPEVYHARFGDRISIMMAAYAMPRSLVAFGQKAINTLEETGQIEHLEGAVSMYRKQVFRATGFDELRKGDTIRTFLAGFRFKDYRKRKEDPQNFVELSIDCCILGRENRIAYEGETKVIKLIPTKRTA